jgi:hypothetical protein
MCLPLCSKPKIAQVGDGGDRKVEKQPLDLGGQGRLASSWRGNAPGPVLGAGLAAEDGGLSLFRIEFG